MTTSRKILGKLTLKKQSLRRLDSAELDAARGGTNAAIPLYAVTNALTNWYGRGDTMAR